MKGFTQKRAVLLVSCLLVASCGPAIDDSFTAVKLRAEQGDANAQFELGVKYDLGRSVPENNEVAVKWYHKAAEQGVTEAQYQLGTMYEFANGVPKDLAEAVNWYDLAAEQEHTKALYHAGRLYYSGSGDIPKDEIKAARCFSQAAEQGHANSQYLLGEMFYTGSGVLQNYYLAYIWLSIAVANGRDASLGRDRSAKALSPDTLLTAQDRVTEMLVEIDERKSMQKG